MSKYAGRVITDLAPAGYSVYFDGTGDYLTVPANAAFNFGTGDFTVEFWLYFQNLTGFQTIFDISYTTSPNLLFQASSGAMAVYMNGGSTVLAASAVSNGTWNHFALVRSGTTVTLYLNGVSVSSATYSGNVGNSTSIVYVGGSLGGSGFYLNGYLSNVRVVKGTALYTAAFTPPTQLFPITNTSLLTCQSPSIIDNSSNAFAITTNGNAAVSTFTPFAAYNPAPTSSNPLTPAPGVWTLDEALQYTQQGVWPSYAVNAIEDVFSTYLYTGTGSTQTITNGIDLSGKGGLVWVKNRAAAVSHVLLDTVRGSANYLSSNTTDSQQSIGTLFSSFNNNGFTVGADNGSELLNGNTKTYVSWTFREQAKFFDVVTYTGTGPGTGANEQQVSHNLGSKPGAIIIKRTDSTGDWWFFTDVIDGSNDFGYLNKTDAFGNSGNNVPTSTVFNVGGVLNTSGATYVAYLFANNAGGFGPAGTDNVISCGSFTTDGSGIATVNLGYEPQWIMFKASSTTSQWPIFDSMRGWTNPANNARLFANLSNAETSGDGQMFPTATGFASPNGGLAANATYIYIAIRRGPMRPPSSGTSVFSPVAQAGTGAVTTVTHGFPVDLWIASDRNNGSSLTSYKQAWFDRLLGNANGFITALDSGWGGGWGSGYFTFESNVGVPQTGNFSYLNASTVPYVYWGFRRAPGFFDQVAYVGTGVATAFAHNLTIVPEMMIVKRRNVAGAWQVYVTPLGNTSYLVMNTTAASVTLFTRWNNTTPTASVFTVGTDGTVNASGSTYTAYLFATVGGVSKVGSYTGTGALQTINCGFTTGARFILIKRTDSTGNWYIYDSARGISSGNDPYLLMNTQAVEVTNTNYVDTTPVGFQVTAAAPADLNASGGTYIFLAIA